MTSEQKSISRLNKKKAAEYFQLQPGYVMHHKDPYLKENDIQRYIQWNTDDLEVMTKSDHIKLHWTFNYEDRCRKISESNIGKHSKPHKPHKPHNYPKKRKDNIELNGDNKQIINSYLTVAELLGLKY